VAEHDALTAPAGLGGLPEEVRSAWDYMPATLAGNLAGIVVVLVLFAAHAPAAVMLPWLAVFAGLWIARLLMTRAFRHASPATRADWQAWRLRWNAASLASGALWGLTAWIFYGLAGPEERTGLIITVYSFCIAAVPVMSTQPRLYLGFAALCFVPMAGRIALEGDTPSLRVAGILLLIFALTTLLARNYRQALQRAIDLKLRSDGLAAQLRIEKQAADEARRAAEIANRAKTQFFTAASHDLRQPLHAMGLFAEALRQRTQDPEAAKLVNSINGSVDALEGLFSELLDITRIDSGGVEVHPAHFAFGDILRKLKLHFEPTAFEKGLALRLRGGARVLHADPLLVERIVRNLVSNAIRYTNDGTVLVSARRRGPRVRVQVWDTGLGIAPAEQAKIFEEFYQVPHTAQLGPEQRKGLGLGLAICQRLAQLMGATLTLRSTPGRGSVFTLDLPAGRLAPAAPGQAVPGKAPLSLTLEGRHIVIVEDEPAVRSGLEVLLQGWGAGITGFDNVAGVEAWIAALPPEAPKPDLLIVDYRLEVGRTGLDAITAVRQRFGTGVPAIVVTGSTMSMHEAEAHDHDFHLLVKPVVPNKLRAMIAFKLQVRPATLPSP
jgi:signal transduction histidine kinase/CheY-like chemotaxis protein